MRALYHIEQELNEINETLINSGGELSPELETRLAITQEELATKATNYGFVILQNQSEIDIIEAEIKRLTAIKKSLDATNEKLKVINSQMGLNPFMAAPTAIPAKPSSAIGVSITRLGPNSSSMPWLTLYAPLYSATSSPSKNTRSSLRISSCMASRNASLN